MSSKRFSLLLVLLAAGALSFAQATLTLLEPPWSVIEEKDAAQSIRRAWQAAVALAGADLAGRLALRSAASSESRGGPGLPALRTIFSGSKGQYSFVIQAEGTPPGTAAEGAASAFASVGSKYSSFAPEDPALYLLVARAIESFARAFEPRSASRPPIFVDAFSPADLVGVDFPFGSSSVYPYAISARKDGSLLVACGSGVVEMDADWRVKGLPAKKLSDEGQSFFASGLALSPSGTLFVRNADGSGLWAFPEGSADYRRLRVEAGIGAWGVLGDGSPYLVPSQGTAIRVWGPQGSYDIPLPKGAMALAADAGPDGTLWIANAADSSFRALSPDGTQRDIVYPELPPGFAVMKLIALRGGGFLAATTKDLRRFDGTGRLLWSWDGGTEGMVLSFSYLSSIATGPGGLIFVNDFSARRVLRLVEPGSGAAPNLLKIASIGADLRARPMDAPLLLELAGLYEASASLEPARAALGRYLEERPADAKAAARELTLRCSLLKAKAASEAADALALLRGFGPETARDSWGRAMRSLEGLKALLPGDTEVQSRIASLREAFRKAEGGQADARPSPEISGVELAALFPSLLQAYRQRPAGFLTVRNSLAEPMKNVSAEIFVQKYMDYPSAGKAVASIAPGASARLELSPLLNERVLEVEEDLPLQARLTLRYTDSHGEGAVELSRPITLYRKTALTWDDTGKLAGFVTPNDETVTRLAFAAVDALDRPSWLSRNFRRAMAICDSLGSWPINYVPDPNSPISSALGNGDMVDTVRFPRMTLALKGGDCDDTTALLCSLLEAAGMRTAILTTPGHVFLAFDSGEKASLAWLLAAPGFETIVSNGTLWIPLESTILQKGFAEAWRSASSLVKSYRGSKDFEFLPLASLRASYAALPLPPSGLPTPPPDTAARAELDAAAISSLDSGLAQPLAATLEAARATLKGLDWDKAGNRLAELHWRFGHPDRAAVVLSEIVQRDRGYVPAWLNLASLSLADGRREDALALLRKALGAVPGSGEVVAWASKAGFAAALSLPAAGPGTAPTDLAASGSGSQQGGAAEAGNSGTVRAAQAWEPGWSGD